MTDVSAATVHDGAELFRTLDSSGLSHQLDTDYNADGRNWAARLDSLRRLLAAEPPPLAEEDVINAISENSENDGYSIGLPSPACGWQRLPSPVIGFPSR